SPDGTTLLFIKNGQKIFRIPLGISEGEKTGKIFALPFLQLPRYMKVRQLWWRDNGDIILLAGGSQRSNAQSLIYHLKGNEGKNAQFRLQSYKDIKKFFPSPDGSILGTLNDTGVTLMSADNFREIKFISHPDPRAFLWMDKDNAVIAGEQYTETVNLGTGERTFITLSQIDDIGFDMRGNIAALNSGKLYRWTEDTGNWQEIAQKEETRIRSAKLESQSYRIYVNVRPSVHNSNQIMVRKINGFGNRALFSVKSQPRTALYNYEDIIRLSEYETRVFSHGSRTRRMELALVFNAIDSDEGLLDVLNTLMDYGIRATFFVGGDFIRQNPDSTKALAASKHEIGSLFYTHMDMADYHYRINKEFVIRGLGRNEDDYFRTTNAEIATLWHAPWYVVNPAILDASSSMNYLYVGRDVDPLDWVTLDTPDISQELYMPSLELIEKILNDVKPGSIVPIRIGKPGKREDYLFNQLELLINSLLWNGYDIVSVGELKEHSL
ncbi:MAG: hypothetical protein B0D92_02175, partial [Spirochaeta sp. LUC14_002_19_P3]